MKKLTKNEMKKVMGGVIDWESEDDGGFGGGCIGENMYECSVTGQEPLAKCCEGLKCVMNCTDTGTICVAQ